MYKTNGIAVTADSLNKLTKTIYRTPNWVIGLIVVLVSIAFFSIIDLINKNRVIEDLTSKNLQKENEDLKKAKALSISKA